MNWSDTGKLTGGDVVFIAGVLVGLAIAGLVGLAGALWVARMVLGG